MADSQLMCLDDNHINANINDKNPQFFYCESQRLALEELLVSGATDFSKVTNKLGVKEFISSKEAREISRSCEKYKEERGDAPRSKEGESEDSLTYWPEKSDVPIPDLDMGWTEHVAYRGITRATVYMHPPKNNDPFIKQIVRTAIQEARKVVAVVMDDFTDRNILEDLLEASYRHRVGVYIVLDQDNLDNFLEMCRTVELNQLKIRNIRVRSIGGTGLYLTAGHLKGTLNQKFMIVDGDKAFSGSYSFTWSSARLHRSSLALFTGQVLEAFDNEFRELYASSEAVDLHGRLGIERSLLDAASAAQHPPPRSSELRPKFYHPKYMLVMEGIRRAASDNQLAADKAENKEKASERTLNRRDSRRGTMKDSKKEDDGENGQAVRDWLLNNDVKGLEHPEPLEDLVPPSRMPNGGKDLGGKDLGPKLRLLDFSRAFGTRSAQGLGKDRSDPPEEASRKGSKGKKKKEEPAKGTRLSPEAEAQDKANAGKSSSSFLERQVSSVTTKSKRDKCRVS
ncbi:protein FAM83F [Amblyraja radiata]|uniref:protein FAM83F n=1 Tax=Amblyraja radiata TaxID=386614 RepID=UPI0014032554|nr:protein FAM83F [Amblyraja radiata]